MKRTLISATLLSLGTALPLMAQTPGAKPQIPQLQPLPVKDVPAMPQLKVQDVVATKAQAFDLADVTLLNSPFKAAMERDANYLMNLSADRFLHGFRREAGLEPKAPIYGGWENAGVAGQTMGHYMSALAMQFRATGEARFKERLDYIVDELALCQNKNGNGYVAAVPDGAAMFADVKAGKGNGAHRGWVPWYTIHKLFAGLRDSYLYTDNDKARDVLVKLSDWAVDTTANLSPEQWQIMLSQEYGGMNETLADVYAITGDKKYLDLSKKFHQNIVIDPLAKQEDKLDGFHANTQVPKIVGNARLYELTGDQKDDTVAHYFWNQVVHHHSYVIGGNSDHEHFGKPDELSKRLSPSTAETCNTYNMLKLTRHLFSWTPNVQYADFYERALYNHILASQEPNEGMVTYYVSLKPGHFKTYSTPEDSFWCCVGTGMENHVKYGDSIYFHHADTLYINGFIPSILQWRDKGLTLRQETNYPRAETTKFTFTAKAPTRAALKIRCPQWLASAAEIKVNGNKQKLAAQAGTYATIERTWRTGDTLEVRLPMQLTKEAMPDDPNKVAFLYGPMVLAGDLGNANMPADLHAKDQGAYFGVSDPRVPVLVTQDKPLNQWLKPVAGQPLWFRTEGAGRPDEVTLKPFTDLYFNRYTVYWDQFTPQQWAQREAEFRAQEARRLAMEARRVDEMRFGEQQSEVDHHLTSEKSGTGRFLDRNWRDARDGGWIAFDMKVLPDAAMELNCTYWGGETDNRQFNVLIDGKVIGTQKLNNDKPGEFFDITYPIPAVMTQGKSQVNVRFQAVDGGDIVGGIFGCSMLKAEP